jgi:hypothetical protein
MKLLGEKAKVLKFVIMNGDLAYVNSGNKILAIPAQLASSASLIKDMPGQSLFVTDPTHYIDNTILCPRNNDCGHTNELSP